MVIIFKASVGFEIVSTSSEAKARKNPSQFQFWFPRRPREQRKGLCLVDQRRIAQPEGASVAQDGQRIHNQCASRSLETVPTRRHARSHQCKAQLCRINRAQQQYNNCPTCIALGSPRGWPIDGTVLNALGKQGNVLPSKSA